MKTSDFDYELPQQLIAQTPIEPRDRSNLLVLNRADGSISHHCFFEVLDFLTAGDVLVFNNSRVIRARLFGKRLDTGRKIEVMLLRRLGPNLWDTLIRSNRRVTAGMQVEILAESEGGKEGLPPVAAEVVAIKEDGVRSVRFSNEAALPLMGKVPLPPYIHAPLEDPERYQTVYAEPEGSVAAPTAGLHFTPELLRKIKEKGVHCLFVTLHVGLNTFRPIRVDDPLQHPMYPEYGVITPEVAAQLSRARQEGRRIICVGTTSVRLVEQAARASRGVPLAPYEGWTDLFIVPGHNFLVVNAMITNFHLPKSTLLMLISAFAGRDLVLKAYREAIDQKYRFYSFGDAMLIL
jgi:S-adenosylmethionine:tRNA ribosyltransferase-isomerase